MSTTQPNKQSHLVYSNSFILSSIYIDCSTSNHIHSNNKQQQATIIMTTTPTSGSSSSSQRSQFQFFNNSGRRFSFTAENLLDCIVTGCTIFVEKMVLVIGPLLICFASVIIGGLAWTFFTILVPMMELDYVNSPYKNIVVGFHVSFVCFLLVEIIFNYYMCVTTRNTGANYEKVVRELAKVTNFVYPETPQDVASFRRDFNDKMMLRMKRRHEREMNYQQHQQQSAAIAVSAATNTTPAVIISEVENNDGTKVTSMTLDTTTATMNNGGDIENNTNNGTTTTPTSATTASRHRCW